MHNLNLEFADKLQAEIKQSKKDYKTNKNETASTFMLGYINGLEEAQNIFNQVNS